jgi:hypothetical protein
VTPRRRGTPEVAGIREDVEGFGQLFDL